MIRNNLDTETARALPLGTRMTLLELRENPTANLGVERIMAQPPPRTMYSNLQYKHFAGAIERSGVKVVVVMRNYKDTMVSQYHFNNGLFQPVHSSFSEYLKDFWEKKLCHGDWCDHVMSWWANHSKDNFLFIRYEDIKADHAGTVRKLARFVGKDLTEEQVQKVVDFTTFEQMKERPKMPKEVMEKLNIPLDLFTRKGISGDWTNHFTKEQAEEVDSYVQGRLKASGLIFKC